LSIISVLIPCYNHSEFIKYCLDSLLMQDTKKVEVLIIDDGSTDNSFEVISDWKDQNFYKFFKILALKQENIGVVKTLNRLISLSSGDFITLLASDDSLTKNSLSIRADYLIKNPDIDGVIGKLFLIDNCNNVLSSDAEKKLFKHDLKLLNNKKTIKKEIILRWSIAGPNTFVRKDIYKIIGDYSEGLVVEDRDFYLRLLSRHNISFLNENVANYRIHTSNTRFCKKKRKQLVHDAAISNVKYSDQFSGFLSFFLKSFIIDLIWSKKDLFLMDIFYFIFKRCRNLIRNVYLFYIRIFLL